MIVAGSCLGSPTRIKFLTPCAGASPCSCVDVLWLFPVPMLAPDPHPKARGLRVNTWEGGGGEGSVLQGVL